MVLTKRQKYRSYLEILEVLLHVAHRWPFQAPCLASWPYFPTAMEIAVAAR